jgi:probable O-glycosylation ligase (exosortase A-associated)
MRDLLVFAFVLALMPSSFQRPYVGLLLFSWLAYMRPQDLCWGFARQMRLSFFVALAMVFGWWANEAGKRRFTLWDPLTLGMVLLVVLTGISYVQAQTHDEYTNRYFFEYLKIVLIAMFTVGQVDSQQRLRAMFWVIALSLGFFGVKNGLLGIARGGGQILRGPGGMLEDNNDFALALTMNIPLLWYLGIAEDKPWIRLATKIGVGLTVVTVLLTHSRGAFLAMCVCALWIAWRSGKLFRAVMVLGLLAALFPLLAPQEVLERLSSIGDTKESSTSARLTAWLTGLRMIGDNPIWGVGMRNFQTRFRDYSIIPDPEQGATYVAHNSYIQIWAESGSLAFLVYLAMLGGVFLMMRKVYRLGQLRPDLAWASNYARMMEATTAAFVVGAFFLNRGHFDLFYHWLALTSAVSLVAAAELRRGPVAMAAAVGARAGEVRVSRPGRRFSVPEAVGAGGSAGAGAGVVWRRRTRWR